MIRKFVEANDRGDEPVTLWGTGSATREFLYVKDAADGLVKATALYDGREPVNMGSGKEISIRDLAHIIADEIGFKGEIFWNASKPDGQPRRALDISRARELFGFEATTDFAEGLKTTIDWYRSVSDRLERRSMRPEGPAFNSHDRKVVETRSGTIL